MTLVQRGKLERIAYSEDNFRPVCKTVLAITLLLQLTIFRDQFGTRYRRASASLKQGVTGENRTLILLDSIFKASHSYHFLERAEQA